MIYPAIMISGISPLIRFRINILGCRIWGVSSKIFIKVVKVRNWVKLSKMRGVYSNTQHEEAAAHEVFVESGAMELASKAMNVLGKASSNNTVINVFLVCGFVGLGVKSMNQQTEIEALEAEKDSLLKTNKFLKKTVWDWKQQLYAEANSSEKPFVPLSKLKSIFGEHSTTPADVEKVEGKAPESKILI